ncbi:hypothetical protein H2204_001496 [Knufia peltigerae]|uniref:magnesium chelatase n=1 Tax=Knufia peltigerae TaxID=1002370 RepID=A0AA38YF58_9EURO|nr:hypothetical protein H2204_001496 [Knufia peltigerae]
MDRQLFLEYVNNLTDLELAVLLSLVAQDHCLIQTPEEFQDDVASELALIVRDIFSLSYIIINKHDLQSIDTFVEAILDDAREYSDPLDQSDDDLGRESDLRARVADVSFRGVASAQNDQTTLDTRKVVNVVIAKDFNLAHEDVQIQALETHQTEWPPCMIAPPLLRLYDLGFFQNDRIFISHHHDPEDGFPNLQEIDEVDYQEDKLSAYSDTKSMSLSPQKRRASRQIGSKLIEQLRAEGQAAIITPEIRRYLQDFVAFLRIERGVDGGVTAYATTLFLALSKYLAPFHGIDYVTPSLIALAAKKVYPHRLIIATPSRERSTLYGTDLATAQYLLEDLDPEKVIQNVLDTIECPT